MSNTQKVTVSAKIVPHLWFVDNAVEAANFYVSRSPTHEWTASPRVQPTRRAARQIRFPSLSSRSPGSRSWRSAQDLSTPFNHAISFIVNCDDQAEIDRLWDALSAGGTIEMCGWLKDRYGVSWQIVPTVLGDMMKDPDRGRARRVTEAMLQMKKFEIVRLEQAYATPTTLKPDQRRDHAKENIRV